MQPGGVHDLRGGTARRLCYPCDSVVVLAGIPGAGKTTLLRRLYGLSGAECTPVTAGGATVLDSEQARNAWRTRLAALPYGLWRPLVHATHHLRVRAALRGDGPVVVHECATRALARWLLREGARRTGREIHLVILDTPPDEARHDQHRRGRVIGGASFRTHVHRWHRLREAAATPGAEACTVLPGARSAVLLDRAAASALTAIDFLD